MCAPLIRLMILTACYFSKIEFHVCNFFVLSLDYFVSNADVITAIMQRADADGDFQLILQTHLF